MLRHQYCKIELCAWPKGSCPVGRFRLNNSKGTGKGLTLYIARAILKLHSPGGGGGANLAPPLSDLGREARDRREMLHKHRG